MENKVKDISEEVKGTHKFLVDNASNFTSFLLKVVFAIIVFYIGGKLIKWLCGKIQHYMEKIGIDKGVATFVSSFVKIMLFALLTFNIATRFGVKESSVAALLGTAGITIGLALQGGLANVAGGITILVFKPFLVGDYIIQNKTSGSEGVVCKIELCYTTLLSYDNKHIVIPNGSLSNSTVINVTALEKRKLELKIGISYNASIEKAREVIKDVISKEEHLDSNDEVLIFVDELADSSVIIGVRVLVPNEFFMQTKWSLNENIKNAFDRNGIEIPYKKLDVNIKGKIL